jgi:hypothetical protein
MVGFLMSICSKIFESQRERFKNLRLDPGGPIHSTLILNNYKRGNPNTTKTYYSAKKVIGDLIS